MKKDKVVDEVIEERVGDVVPDKPVVRKKPGNLSELKSHTMSIQKYFRFHDSEIHVYMRAYAEEVFRGIMKTKDEWETEMRKIMGDDK